MSGLEDRLREAFLDAADLVGDDAVPAWAPARREGSKRRAAWAGAGRNRPARRGRGIAPAAAAAAVAALAVTAGVIVPHVLAGQHARSHSRHGAPEPPVGPAAGSGLPAFAVVSSGTGLKVVQTATGHVTGQVSAPAGQVFNQVAGDGSDRTFYVAAQQLNYQAPCRTYFYRFTLTAAGAASALTPLPGSGQAGLPTALAASADGSKLAFSVVHCAGGAATKIPLSQAIGYIAVRDLVSGKITGHWTYALGEDYPIDMALTADGDLLAFAQYLPDGSAIVAKTLRTGIPSGTVDHASRAVGLRGVSSLSAGPALYGCISVDRPGRKVANQLGAYDLATGHRTAVLHTWTGSSTSCTLAPNPNHGHLLVAIASTRPPKPKRSAGRAGSAGRSHGASVQAGQGIAVFTIRVFAVDVVTGRLTRLLTINASTDYAIIGW